MLNKIYTVFLYSLIFNFSLSVFAMERGKNEIPCKLRGLQRHSPVYISEKFKTDLITQIKKLKNSEQITMTLVQGKTQLTLHLTTVKDTLHLTLLPIKQAQIRPDYYKRNLDTLLSLLNETSQAIQRSNYSKVRLSTFMENELEVDLASTEINNHCTGQNNNSDSLRSRELAGMGIAVPAPTNRFNRWLSHLGNFLRLNQAAEKDVTIYLRTGSILQ